MSRILKNKVKHMMLILNWIGGVDFVLKELKVAQL